MAEEDQPVIVIDAGSRMCRAGFAGDEAPRSVFPSCVGRHWSGAESNQRETFVGDIAISKRGILKLTHPIERGVVTNWEDMEHICSHMFENELCVSSGDHCILLTESPLQTSIHRERCLQLFFESFHSPGVYLAPQPSLVLRALDRTTGVVFDSGHTVSHAVAVEDGLLVAASVLHSDLGGADVTDYLMKRLSESGYALSGNGEREFFRDMKEKFGYVAVDWQHEMDTVSEKLYELPDGHAIAVTTHRFECFEPMFQPQLRALRCTPIHQLIHDSIMRCDATLQPSLFSNIVLAGGNTRFPHLAARLTHELNRMAPTGMEVHVTDTSPDSEYLAWIGGSMLACMSTFQQMCISKQEYEEVGPSVVHQKCPYQLR
eukprot:TRINITY_DN8537_c0_g3_i1.p1 TRINITY_DN8537_c0_g3~~TRINITY_DN8537_c0_g3_i1.p1  ORF type:complete len:374 (+),score=61.23 TRINITY_DN8537_c0_g3_i1:58-1179(+)